jgi:hypothetical protein
LLTAEGCIAVGYCDGRTYLKFQLTLSVGDGWWFGGSVTATFRAIVNGKPGGCVANNRAMDLTIGLNAVMFGWEFGTEFGPWGMGASGDVDGEVECKDTDGFADKLGWSCYWGWGGKNCSKAARPSSDGGWASYGYDRAAQADIIKNCKDSCGYCNGRRLEGTLHNRRLDAGKKFHKSESLRLEAGLAEFKKGKEVFFPAFKTFKPPSVPVV